MEMTIAEEAENRLLEVANRIYRDPMQRGSMRGGMGDAAALCDAIARQIVIEHTYGGRVTKVGRELEAVAKRCADAIRAMREQVKVLDAA
jgi:hypothetical protein